MILYDNQVVPSNAAVAYQIYLGLLTENKRIESILSDSSNNGVYFEKAAASTVVASIKVGDKIYKDPGTGSLYLHINHVCNAYYRGVL